jgi:hypothetical protein
VAESAINFSLISLSPHTDSDWSPSSNITSSPITYV